MLKVGNLEIINFDEKYTQYFYDLNAEWLNKHFYIEPYDEMVLSNPKKFIIDNNGYIFFAKIDDKIVGVVSLINQKTFYELSKMAVSPEYRGLQIGEKLVKSCMDFGKKKNWNEIILYSNTKLAPAINLYKKLGFVEVPLEVETTTKERISK